MFSTQYSHRSVGFVYQEFQYMHKTVSALRLRGYISKSKVPYKNLVTEC